MTDATSHSIVLRVTRTLSVQQSILETLAYSDVFDHPLTFDELHRYLTKPTPRADLAACLSDMSLVHTESGFYFLAHRHEIVKIRMEREQKSQPAFQRALQYGRILGSLPFVRMAALTGSLAMLNLSQHIDMDYMLITQPGRLWLARAVAVTFGRFMRLFGDRICVNLLVSESAMEWQNQDLYSAREMCQMIPITGRDVYAQFRAVNAWTDSFLPQATSTPELTPHDTVPSFLQKWMEAMLRGGLGDCLETWAMDFQLKKIRRTYGTSGEANFSPTLCQGNFHDHRSETDAHFLERLSALYESENISA